MVIGANPTDGHPVFASRMKQRLREGAKLIVIDPRRIDLVRTPHVEAALPPAAAARHQRRGAQRDGACRSSPRGWSNEDFVRDRCEEDAFAEWAAFIAEARNSPEAVAKVTGVPAAEIRAAARLYATGGNAAIYYGLGVTEHSQGTTTVMAHRQPGDGDRQYRPAGRRRQSAARPEQRAGLLRHGHRFPHELPGYRHVSDAAVRAIFEREWGVTLDPEPGLRIPNMFDAAIDGTFRGIYVQGEDIAAVRSRTRTTSPPRWRRWNCVVVQDLFLNETANYAHVFLPGAIVPGEGRHLHQRRAAHQPRAQGDGAARRHGGLGGDAGDRQRHGLPMHYAIRREIMDEIARTDADLRRRRPSPSWTRTARCSGRATSKRRTARR